jgi:hypothetical protein
LCNILGIHILRGRERAGNRNYECRLLRANLKFGHRNVEPNHKLSLLCRWAQLLGLLWLHLLRRGRIWNQWRPSLLRTKQFNEHLPQQRLGLLFSALQSRSWLLAVGSKLSHSHFIRFVLCYVDLYLLRRRSGYHLLLIVFCQLGELPRIWLHDSNLIFLSSKLSNYLLVVDLDGNY